MFGWFKRKKKVEATSPNVGKGLPSSTLKVTMPNVAPPKRDPNPVNANRPSHFTSQKEYGTHMRKSEDNWNDPLNPMLTTYAAMSILEDETKHHTPAPSCDNSSSYSSSDSSSSYSSSYDSSSSSSSDSSSSCSSD